jgi:hypothetical protein
MLNLSFVVDDAIQALTKYASYLAVVPLPATVYMMQVDVINHYRYALDHYLTLTLDESFLQNSSIGPPYRKWAHFTNEDFGMLALAINNLLRYTSRLIHETECHALREHERFDEERIKSNSYTGPICDVRYSKKIIGVTVHDDHRLSIVPVCPSPDAERVFLRCTVGEPMAYFRVTKDSEGNDHEQLIGIEEYDRITAANREETIDIRDRSRLMTIQMRGHAEIAGLERRNRRFAKVCNLFYQSRSVAQPFKNLNESYWM